MPEVKTIHKENEQLYSDATKPFPREDVTKLLPREGDINNNLKNGDSAQDYDSGTSDNDSRAPVRNADDD
jgi:hypothetical protein